MGKLLLSLLLAVSGTGLFADAPRGVFAKVVFDHPGDPIRRYSVIEVSSEGTVQQHERLIDRRVRSWKRGGFRNAEKMLQELVAEAEKAEAFGSTDEFRVVDPTMKENPAAGTRLYFAVGPKGELTILAKSVHGRMHERSDGKGSARLVDLLDLVSDDNQPVRK